MQTGAIASLGPRVAVLALCGAFGLGLVPAAPVAAAAAAGGGNPFNELVGGQAHQTAPTTTGTRAHQTAPTTTGTQAHQTTPTTTGKTNTTPTETTHSNSKTVIFLVFGVGIVLLLGIGFAIMRDARRFAPVGDGPVGEGRPARDPAARLRKRRAQSKAARQQRKRNR